MKRTSTLVLAPILALAAVATVRADDAAGIAKRAALMTPDTRAQSFRSMDTAFPFHVIQRGGPVAELPRAERKLDVTYSYSGQTHTLDDLLARSGTQGFLVVKDGKVVEERYFNGADETSKFTSWSVGKSFTSTLVGLALADGKIKSVDDPITEYLPELKGSGYDTVPIKDILEMSSGVKFTEEYGNGQSDVSIMWNATMVQESQSIGDYAKTLGRAEAPGTKFVYRSVDTAVLGMLVHRVTGERLADMLSRRIWQPLGMEHDATWLTDRSGPAGLEAAFCCINATLRDYARFGLLFLHRGKSGDRQLVPEKWIDEATNPQSPQVRYGPLFRGAPIGYGYQWWLPAAGDDHPYTAEGVFFQFVYVNPKYNLVIVKTSAYDDFWNVPLEIEQFLAFDAIGRTLEKD